MGASAVSQGLDVLRIVELAIQSLTLIFLIIYVVKTWQMAGATRDSVGEMRAMRELSVRPYVIVHPDVSPEGAIDFVVENVGASPACHITFCATGLMDELRGYEGRVEAFLHQGLTELVPASEYRVYWGKSSELCGMEPAQITVEVRYQNAEGTVYAGQHRLCLQELGLMRNKRRKALAEIADAVSDVADALKGNMQRPTR